MSVQGVCEICEAKPVVDGCDRCGRLVCEDHYDASTGLCTQCLAAVGGPPDDREPTDRDRPDGVDEHQF